MANTVHLVPKIDAAVFAQRIRTLKQLQQDAQNAFKAASRAILSFAVEYSAVYQMVRRNRPLIDKLNDALNLEEWQAIRLRTIGEQANVKRLKAIQGHLPPSLESIYEVSRLPDQKIRQAIDSGHLTPDATLKDIRNVKNPERAADVDAGGKVWQVVLMFDKKNEATESTAEILSHTTASVRIPDPGLRDDIKRKIGKNRWAGVESRVSK